MVASEKCLIFILSKCLLFFLCVDVLLCMYICVQSLESCIECNNTQVTIIFEKALNPDLVNIGQRCFSRRYLDNACARTYIRDDHYLLGK